MNQPNEPMDSRERQARRAAMRKKRMRRQRQQLIALAGLAVLVIVLVIVLFSCTGKDADDTASTNGADTTLTADLPEDTEAAVTQNWMRVPADRQLTASQYFVFDCTDSTFLTLPEAADTRIYPASITKLTTACVVMKYLKPDDVITAGAELNLVAAGSSVAELEKGDALTVSQLIGGMILPSGNDAAYVLATAAGRVILDQPSADAETAIAAFVEEMNRYASRTGLIGTHFANPDGIHKENHYTTYQDLVTMAMQALQNESLMEYCATGNAVVQAGERELKWHNTNLLVDPENEFYCPIAVGLKTGQTPYAGSCLLSAFQTGETTLIIGVFGCPDIESRFLDTLQLLNEVLFPAY